MRATKIIAVTAITVAVLLAAGIDFYRHQKEQLTKTAEYNLLSVAHLKVHVIETWRKERLGDAMVLTESPFLADAISAWLERPTPELDEKMKVRLTSMMRNYDYQDVALVDKSGAIRMNTGAEKLIIDSEENQALKQAFSSMKPFVTDLHISSEHSGPHITIMAPVIKRTGERVEPVAAVALCINAHKYLYPLVQSWPLPTKSAETLIVRRDGNDVLFLNELKHKKDTAVKFRLPLTEKKVPAVMAVMGKSGVFPGVDYRGVEVLSAIADVPGTPWKMVSKIDKQEAFAAWKFRSMMIIGLITSLIAVVFAAAGIAWQRGERQHFKALYAAEERMRKAEEGYRVTLMCIGDGVITTDEDGRVELLNPVAETLTGWRQFEAAGKPLEEIFVIVSEETREKVDNPATRAAKEGIITGLANHTLLISKDGTERPIADSAAPIRAADGKITGAVLVFRDQTEERAAQIELEQSNARLAAAAQELKDAQTVGGLGSYVLDIVSGVWTSSVQLDDIFGIDGNFERIAESWVEIVHPSWRDIMWKYFTEEVVGRGEKFDKEYMIKRISDGAERWVHGLGRLEKDADGRPLKMIGTIQDVTVRKRAEDEMLKLRKIESVGVLAGGIAHDFNNALGAILGGIDYAIALSDSNPEECLKTLIGAKQSVFDARNLTQQLITFAKGGAPALKDASIADLLRETTSFTLRGSKCRPVLDIAPDIRNVSMDPGQISQVVQNLLMNADQAMPDGGTITISAKNAAPSGGVLPPGDYVQVRVEDQGIGIQPDHLSKIFDPYFTTKQKGHGLGLATTFSIINKHGGRISAYSEPGKGSSFMFWLPATDTVAASPERAPVAAPRGDGVRVLLMDDNMEMSEKIAKLLRHNKYEAELAPDGVSALDMYKQAAAGGNPFHVVVLDLTIPGGMGGIQTITALREFDPDVVAIVASGYSNEPALADPHAYGFAAGLSKPYMFSELADIIVRVLGRK